MTQLTALTSKIVKISFCISRTLCAVRSWSHSRHEVHHAESVPFAVCTVCDVQYNCHFLRAPPPRSSSSSSLNWLRYFRFLSDSLTLSFSVFDILCSPQVSFPLFCLHIFVGFIVVFFIIWFVSIILHALLPIHFLLCSFYTVPLSQRLKTRE